MTIFISEKVKQIVDTFYFEASKLHSMRISDAIVYSSRVKIAALNIEKLPHTSICDTLDCWKGYEVRWCQEINWYFAFTRNENSITIVDARHGNHMSNLVTLNGGTVKPRTNKYRKPWEYNDDDDKHTTHNGIEGYLDNETKEIINQITNELNKNHNFHDILLSRGITSFKIDYPNVEFTYDYHKYYYDRYYQKTKLIESIHPKKKRIRLTESQLNNIIRRCINEVLRLRR